jgi:hypothetical protein
MQTPRAEIYIFTMGTLYKISSRILVLASLRTGIFTVKCACPETFRRLRSYRQHNQRKCGRSQLILAGPRKVPRNDRMAPSPGAHLVRRPWVPGHFLGSPSVSLPSKRRRHVWEWSVWLSLLSTPGRLRRPRMCRQHLRRDLSVGTPCWLCLCQLVYRVPVFCSVFWPLIMTD